MKSKRILIVAVFSLLSVLPVFTISFDDLNLSGDDKLLFSAEFESRSALFLSSLDDRTIQQLTAYPEKMQVVNHGRTIITINRFGAARIPVTGGLPAQLPGYPSFAEGSVPLKGRLMELAASSDGRWIIYLEPTSPAYGNLILAEIPSGAVRIISERVEIPGADFPAKWSPDSRYFVYSKGGRLYYFPIINDLSVLVDERFRLIGSGGINSILWGGQGDFYYFTGNTLYRVLNPELFTRTIYGDFLSIGSVAGLFPFEFDPRFDSFWIAPGSNSILVRKNEKGFFLFSLGANQGREAGIFPHFSIPSGAANLSILWSGSGLLTICFSVQNQITIWRFETADGIKNISTNRNNPESSTGALSPDGTRAVFWGESGLELWDYTGWQIIQRLSREPVLACAWINNSRLITGNKNFIEELNFSGAAVTQRRICLSSADESGFESARQTRIVAKKGNEWFATDGRSQWTPAANPQLRQVSLSTDRYRAYLETRPSVHFKNTPMIRNLTSAVTASLVANHTVNNAFVLNRPVRIALCFDLYDDETGVFHVLSALNRYKFRATFFLNGDFIRRNPAAASAIASAGHETASLFYAPIDFSDTRYRITQDFIVQGLARNEDEFFKATGREFSLLWHPPYYRSSNLISSSAASAGYITTTRTFDPGDWLSRNDILRLNLRQPSTASMVEQILTRSTNGAIIPIRLGLLAGGRDEYLFQSIDVLLDALIRSGIEIVPVSTIIGR